jgi:hypothetical protein
MFERHALMKDVSVLISLLRSKDNFKKLYSFFSFPEKEILVQFSQYLRLSEIQMMVPARMGDDAMAPAFWLA